MADVLLKYVSYHTSDVTPEILREALLEHSTREQVRLIIETVNGVGLNAITVAVIRKELTMLKLLLDLFEQLVRFRLIVSGNGMFEAAERGYFKIVEYMLHSLPLQLREELMMMVDHSGQIALHYAIREGYFDVVKCMMAALPEDTRFNLLRMQCFSGNAALHFASSLNYPKIVKFLIQSVAAEHQRVELLSIPGGERNLPIDCAAKLKCPDVMRKIVDLVPRDQLFQLFQTRERGGSPTLHFAASYSCTETVQCILEKLSAEERFELIAMPGQLRPSPIFTAAWHGHIETVVCMVKMLTRPQQVQLSEQIDIDGLQGVVEKRNSPESTQLLNWISSIKAFQTVLSGKCV